MLQTVLGEIPNEEAGIVLIHEHILWGWTKEVKQHYPKENVIKIMLPLLQDLKKAGCSTLVEATTAGAGRDARLLKEISQMAELNIITNCGVWDGFDQKCMYVPDFIKNRNKIRCEFEDGIKVMKVIKAAEDSTKMEAWQII